MLNDRLTNMRLSSRLQSLGRVFQVNDSGELAGAVSNLDGISNSMGI